jgi:RNA polymerase sigma-70 factor (ECF subfamily)
MYKIDGATQLFVLSLRLCFCTGVAIAVTKVKDGLCARVPPPVKLWQRFGRSDIADPDGARVAAARAGDAEAFDALLRLYDRQLRGFLARRVSSEAVEDVLQETRLAVWTGLAEYRGQSRFKAWLFGIALNKCGDYHRRRGRQPHTQWFAGEGEAGAEEILARLADPHDPYSEVDLRHAIEQALRLLPETQRQVMELYYYAGLTLAEAAIATGRSESTVKYQFYRAHTRLAEVLGPILALTGEVFGQWDSPSNLSNSSASAITPDASLRCRKLEPQAESGAINDV